MTIDIKRKKLELSKVRVAREELELKIEERLEEIDRLKKHVEIQLEKEKDLQKEINK